MKLALCILTIFCSAVSSYAQTSHRDTFFPFATTRENYLRQREFVERLQKEYVEQARRSGGGDGSTSRFNQLPLRLTPPRFQRDEEGFPPLPPATQASTPPRFSRQDVALSDAQTQIQKLQQMQEELLIQQGQAAIGLQQQFQQQQLQQQLITPSQLTRDQLEEVQKQQEFTAQNQGQFQNQILQQNAQQQSQIQRQIQQQIQQQQLQEQLRLQQGEGRQEGRMLSFRSRPATRQHEHIRPVRQEPMTEICLACICQASTSCNLTTQCISGGQYCGPFLISRPYWLDAGAPTLLGDSPSRPGAFEDCTADPVCSAQTVRTYMTKFMKDCNNDGRIDCNDLGRIHLLGPYSCSDPSVSQSPFFQKFQQCFTKASRF